MRLVRIVCFVLVLSLAPWAVTQTRSAKGDVPSEFPFPPSPGNAPAPLATRLQPGDCTELQVLRMEKVRYPDEARRKGIQGQVTVRVDVSETGKVEKVQPLSGDPTLIPAALASVKKWKYKPFIRNGKPVKVSTLLPLDFAFGQNVQDILLDTSPPPESGVSISGPVTLASGLMTSRLVHKVVPVYPSSAISKQVEGKVVLRALIGKKGRIRGLTVISGPREFFASALGAVQQWRYRPYLANGSPVEVTTDIELNYQLQ